MKNSSAQESKTRYSTVQNSTVQYNRMNTLYITENQCQHEREVIFSVLLPIIRCLKNTEINYEKNNF